MPARLCFATLFMLFLIHLNPLPACGETPPATLETALSETLDLWREGKYEQLYGRLARRTRMSREAFVAKMQSSTVKPACCWQKLQDFKVISEKKTEATVFARIGIENSNSPVTSNTREYRLSHDEGIWKMQLTDICNLAGLAGKKSKGMRNRRNQGQY